MNCWLKVHLNWRWIHIIWLKKKLTDKLPQLNLKQNQQQVKFRLPHLNQAEKRVRTIVQALRLQVTRMAQLQLALSSQFHQTKVNLKSH